MADFLIEIVLTNNKSRVELLKKKLCQTLIRLNIRKKTLDTMIKKLEKQVKSYQNLDFNKEILKTDEEILRARALLPSIYSDNKNRYLNI